MEKEIWPWEGHQCIVQGLAVPFRRKSNSASNWTISTSARHHSTAQINGKRFIVAAARYIDAGIFPDAVLLAGLLCQNPYSKTPQLRLSKSLCLLQGTLKWTKIPMFFRWKKYTTTHGRTSSKNMVNNRQLFNIALTSNTSGTRSNSISSSGTSSINSSANVLLIYYWIIISITSVAPPMGFQSLAVGADRMLATIPAADR
jgi:hypothetical protein